MPVLLPVRHRCAILFRGDEPMKIAVICISDSAFAGQRTDESGPLISEILADLAETAVYTCLPDDRDAIKAELARICDEGLADAVFTTGGTGLAPRDVTPEATLAVIERKIPGIPEAMRAKGLTYTPRAMLSRAVAGVRGSTLIVNMPGSPKAVRENLEVLRPVLEHAVELIQNKVKNCAAPDSQR